MSVTIRQFVSSINDKRVSRALSNVLDRVLPTKLDTALTAHASGGQTNALQLNEGASYHDVTTVATAADSVVLPGARVGQVHFVKNSGANSMQVYAPSPDTIDSVATGTGVPHPAGTSAVYACSVDGNYIRISGVPSTLVATIAGITASSTELNYTDITTLGTVQASKAVTADASNHITWAATSASTDGGTSVEPFVLASTMSGTGGVGGRARFQLNATGALGGWSNALKAITVYTGAGKTTGLGSALCAELTLSAGTTTGTYAPLESEVTLVSGASLGTATSFLYCNVTDDSATFNTSGFFFELGAGVVDTSSGLFDAVSKTGIGMTHTLRCRIGGTAYYLALHTDPAHGGS